MTEKSRKKLATLPCLACGKGLEDVGSGEINHPSKAVVFRSPGQYGSTVFDPMDGSTLEVNICDDCIVTAAKKFRVILSEPPNHIARRQKNSYWDGKG